MVDFALQALIEPDWRRWLDASTGGGSVSDHGRIYYNL